MLSIKSPTHNPFFNIAAEEYLLKRFSEDVFFTYRNSPSVIVGKHQNTMGEIDFVYTQKNGIEVVRRMSGGGAVYHDYGNVNFTFIRNGKQGALVDFKGFTKPIVEMLGTLGVKAKFEGNNSLTVNGLKVSGNAEHVYKQRVMHHGTLLFQTDLSALANVLYVRDDRFISERAVKSVRASTANLSDFLPNGMQIEEFALYLFEYISKTNDATEYFFSSEDLLEIERLVNEKYGKWEWNYGYSPFYSLKREIQLQNKIIKLEVHVEKGIISFFKMEGELPSSCKKSIEAVLEGTPHSIIPIQKSLKNAKLDPQLVDVLTSELF